MNFKFTTFRTFIKEIFQDGEDGFSSKRTGFFVFIILLAVCTVAGVFFKVAVPAMVWNGLVDLIKWIGAAILGERAPQALAALRGNLPDKKPDILP